MHTRSKPYSHFLQQDDAKRQLYAPHLPTFPLTKVKWRYSNLDLQLGCQHLSRFHFRLKSGIHVAFRSPTPTKLLPQHSALWRFSIAASRRQPGDLQHLNLSRRPSTPWVWSTSAGPAPKDFVSITSLQCPAGLTIFESEPPIHATVSPLPKIHGLLPIAPQQNRYA